MGRPRQAPYQADEARRVRNACAQVHHKLTMLAQALQQCPEVDQYLRQSVSRGDYNAFADMYEHMRSCLREMAKELGSEAVNPAEGAEGEG
jgi:hypothetical protein